MKQKLSDLPQKTRFVLLILLVGVPIALFVVFAPRSPFSPIDFSIFDGDINQFPILIPEEYSQDFMEGSSVDTLIDGSFKYTVINENISKSFIAGGNIWSINLSSTILRFSILSDNSVVVLTSNSVPNPPNYDDTYINLTRISEAGTIENKVMLSKIQGSGEFNIPIFHTINNKSELLILGVGIKEKYYSGGLYGKSGIFIWKFNQTLAENLMYSHNSTRVTDSFSVTSGFLTPNKDHLLFTYTYETEYASQTEYHFFKINIDSGNSTEISQEKVKFVVISADRLIIHTSKAEEANFTIVDSSLFEFANFTLTFKDYFFNEEFPFGQFINDTARNQYIFVHKRFYDYFFHFVSYDGQIIYTRTIDMKERFISIGKYYINDISPFLSGGFYHAYFNVNQTELFIFDSYFGVYFIYPTLDGPSAEQRHLTETIFLLFLAIIFLLIWLSTGLYLKRNTGWWLVPRSEFANRQETDRKTMTDICRTLGYSLPAVFFLLFCDFIRYGVYYFNNSLTLSYIDTDANYLTQVSTSIITLITFFTVSILFYIYITRYNKLEQQGQLLYSVCSSILLLFITLIEFWPVISNFSNEVFSSNPLLWIGAWMGIILSVITIIFDLIGYSLRKSKYNEFEIAILFLVFEGWVFLMLAIYSGGNTFIEMLSVVVILFLFLPTTIEFVKSYKDLDSDLKRDDNTKGLLWMAFIFYFLPNIISIILYWIFAGIFFICFTIAYLVLFIIAIPLLYQKKSLV